MTAIAFLGLGAMSSRIARRLADAGHDLTVWNRDPAKGQDLVARGALRAESPRVAAQGADTVVSMVRDDEASRRVWLNPVDGALIGMWPGTLALECSTLTPAWVLELAAAVSARDVAFLDAPVAGSRPQAEAGALVFMVGGGAVDVERAGPLLEAMGAAVHHAWATGSGALVKLGVNAMLGIQVAALAEVLGLMRVGGVDPARAVEILGATPVMSPATGAAAASMLARRFAPLFPVELVEKDNSYVSAAAESLGGATPLAGAAREVMRQAIAESYGDENLTGNVRLYDRQNASTADLGRP